MKYTQIPVTLQQELQMNAGVLVESFNPETGEISGIIGATSGGVQFSDVPEYVDLGEDIDNAPKNTKELKRISGREIKLSGSFTSITPALAKMLIATGTIVNTVKIVPRDDISSYDFKTLWLVGDYSNVNTGSAAGFIAIKLMNVLNTSGFNMQTADKEKGKFSFEFTAHYSIDAQDVVPYEMYVKAGTGAGGDASIMLDKHSMTLKENETATLTAVAVPAGQTVTWLSSNGSNVTVTNGSLSAVAAGSAIITASITVDGVTYTDTCTVIVEAEE